MEKAKKEKKTQKMVVKNSWETFRECGLLLFINQILHIFGWAIVYDIDKETKKITDVFPARVRFRGFDPESISKAYLNLTQWLKGNVDDLLTEAKE